MLSAAEYEHEGVAKLTCWWWGWCPARRAMGEAAAADALGEGNRVRHRVGRRRRRSPDAARVMCSGAVCFSFAVPAAAHRSPPLSSAATAAATAAGSTSTIGRREDNRGRRRSLGAAAHEHAVHRLLLLLALLTEHSLAVANVEAGGRQRTADGLVRAVAIVTLCVGPFVGNRAALAPREGLSKACDGASHCSLLIVLGCEQSAAAAAAAATPKVASTREGTSLSRRESKGVDRGGRYLLLAKGAVSAANGAVLRCANLGVRDSRVEAAAEPKRRRGTVAVADADCRTETRSCGEWVRRRWGATTHAKAASCKNHCATTDEPGAPRVVPIIFVIFTVAFVILVVIACMLLLRAAAKGEGRGR